MAHRDLIHDKAEPASSDLEAWLWWTQAEKPHAKLMDGWMYVSQWKIFAALDGLQQNPKYHAEDVWQHTVMVVQKATEHELFCSLVQPKVEALLLAALLHDTGKAVTTVVTRRGISSKGHAAASAGIAERFLRDLGAGEYLVRLVVELCRDHMDYKRSVPSHVADISKILASADTQGRINDRHLRYALRNIGA